MSKVKNAFHDEIVERGMDQSEREDAQAYETDMLLRRTIGILGLARKNLVYFAQEKNEGVIAIDRLLPDLHAALLP